MSFFSAGRCTNRAYPVLLTAEPESVAEAALVRSLVACGSNAMDALWLKNTSSHGLWVVDAPSYSYWAPEQDARESFKVALFREAVRRYYAGNVPDGLLTLEPGVAIVLRVPPELVHLRLDAGLQGAWSTTAMGLQAVQNATRRRLENVVGRRSPTRGAIVACAIDGYLAGQAISESDKDPSSALVAGLGIFSNGPCVQRVSELKTPTQPRPPLSVSALGNVAKPTSGWSSSTRSALSAALRAVTAAVTR
jgi:hypothetical protein